MDYLILFLILYLIYNSSTAVRFDDVSIVKSQQKRTKNLKFESFLQCNVICVCSDIFTCMSIILPAYNFEL